MQMRFDGNIGFPGGLLDEPGEAPAEALNREMQEEIALDLAKYSFTQDDHIISHVNTKKKLITHFYVMEVTKQQYNEIEKNSINAKEWGIEVRS